MASLLGLDVRRHEALDALSPYDPTAAAITDLGRINSGPRFRGGIDWFRNAILSGWAIDLAQPHHTLRIAVVADGVTLGEAETSIRRLDLEPFVPKNAAGFRVDLRQWDKASQRRSAERLESMPPDELAAPCDLVVRLGDGGSWIDVSSYGVTKGDVLAQLRTALADPSPAALPPTIERPAAERVAFQHRIVSSLNRPHANGTPSMAIDKGLRGNIGNKVIISTNRIIADPDNTHAAWLTAELASERQHAVAILHCLCAGTEGFAPYAADVGNDPRRLFAFALEQAIQRITFVSERIKAHAAAIASLFDPNFYLATYPQTSADCDNPLLHYVLMGWRDELCPNPLLDLEYYRAQMGGVRGDPLLHYIQHGAAAGLNPHPLFDTEFYRATYLSAEDRGINPLYHYQMRGGLARFAPSPLFDTERFLQALPFADSIACPLEAFLKTREFHDCDVVPVFDAKLYRYQLEIERHQPLHEPPLVHYLRAGFRDETLLPNLFFDPHFYRERNALTLDGPALLHYLSNGHRLGYACHPLFSAKFYNEQRGADHDSTTALEHFWRHPEMGLKTDHRMQRPPDQALLRFVRRLLDGNHAFDPFFYRDANRDLTSLDEASLRFHYENHGKQEGRVGSEATVMRNGKVTINDVSMGFFADEYVRLNPDLDYLKDNFIGSICHYLLHGRHEKDRMIGKWQFHYDDIDLDILTSTSPLRVIPAQRHMELCILIHVYYADVWKELASFAQNFRNRSCDVFINLVDVSWTPELHREIRELCPGAFLQMSNDSGRDVGGFVRLLDNVQIDRYDMFAFMHTKKSPHIAQERGEHWRRTLLRAIAGSVEIADECIDTFLKDPSVGMIGAKEWRSFDMGKNFDQYEKLLDLLDVEGANRELDYLSGFMFLTRGDVVKRLHGVLREMEWEYGGDKGVEFHMDGQIAHGVERAVPALVRQMGYQVVYR